MLSLEFLPRIVLQEVIRTARREVGLSRAGKPPKGWMKINIDAFRRHSTRSVSIGYVTRDNHASHYGNWKQIRDCFILCLYVCM